MNESLDTNQNLYPREEEARNPLPRGIVRPRQEDPLRVIVAAMPVTWEKIALGTAPQPRHTVRSASAKEECFSMILTTVMAPKAQDTVLPVLEPVTSVKRNSSQKMVDLLNR